MQIIRSHIHSDRYDFDFKHCATDKGFAQINTGQDASYFGTWANPFKLQIVNYCEGDITIQTAINDQEFCEEIRRIKTWNEEMGFAFLGIDPGFNKELKRRFEIIGLGGFLH